MRQRVGFGPDNERTSEFTIRTVTGDIGGLEFSHRERESHTMGSDQQQLRFDGNYLSASHSPAN